MVNLKALGLNTFGIKGLRFKLLVSIILSAMAIAVPVSMVIAKSDIVIIVITAMACFGFVVYIIFLISRHIIKPIEDCIDFAQQVGQGNLKVVLDIKSTDELGILEQSLQAMSQKLLEMVEHISEGTNKLGFTAKSLSGSSKHLITAAYHQNDSSEKVIGSVKQMMQYIKQNTENSKKAEQVSKTANKKIEESAEVSSKAFASMHIIADKISIVNDIAFQTNILALNAAVEAARAGEHGRGFSVVAAEVRKLAERSKQAADEIILISNNSRNDSETAGQMLANAVPDIKRNTELITEITHSSLEQNSNIDEINTAVVNLNELSTQNSSNAKKIAVFSGEIEAQADKLKQLINFFKVGN